MTEPLAPAEHDVDDVAVLRSRLMAAFAELRASGKGEDLLKRVEAIERRLAALEAANG